MLVYNATKAAGGNGEGDEGKVHADEEQDSESALPTIQEEIWLIVDELIMIEKI